MLSDLRIFLMYVNEYLKQFGSEREREREYYQEAIDGEVVVATIAPSTDTEVAPFKKFLVWYKNDDNLRFLFFYFL